MPFSELSCEAFIEVLASKEPVPGGGGAAALVGAIGTALGNMVGSLTLGKKKYADVQDDIVALKEKAGALQKEFIALMQKDAEVFEPLSRAYGMPRDTEEEKAQKAQIMEEALTACCEVPLAIMRCCASAIELQEEFARKGTAIAVSDAGCGAICCKAALQAASLNVFINTKAMANRERAERYNKEAGDILCEYTAMADRVFTEVAARFN
ncbi:MAG: cyclodeaminase/cyclohydrolase family protein [Oscillospiraceae bacterium]|jgi:formiminotetrahydrofolate cyclodeaminase|nr:cyclodeaminase/cyclohydrolase family protein [Oscillospiraceae bacterium]